MSRVVRFHRTGDAQVLQIDEVDVAAPEAGEVQIRVKALGINRAEIMYRTGQYVIEPRFPAILGYEAAGLVEALGPDVAGFNIGDAVSVVPAFSFADYGMYGELVNVPVHALVKHPENLSFEKAAASWMMFITAYGALIDIGNLQAGETVLIRAASSSVGLAAIQVANMVGAVPVALTRTSQKRQALLDAGAAHIIATEEQDLTNEVMSITDGKGARMAFDPVGGVYAGQIFKVLGMQGIFFQYGALDDGDIPVPVMDVLGKRLTLRGYELFEITGDPKKLEQAKSFVSAGLASGKLHPVIDRTFAFEEIAKAHRHMEANAQVGKIVVTL
ncbi:zinc-dependent alcohol dehydrogenase family protein [Stutzerimonas nitrititolerans]|uniref:zinc-dependent alcohol dehydrogenase family protein n=1 Tax=Stutzerimonas nitrititolerans TaxID=2482751 RepID=UPI0028A15459|nr:zinc-dependent alcohol dehydrogenase family protein [Stutzerimonas nitrititolerans]